MAVSRVLVQESGWIPGCAQYKLVSASVDEVPKLNSDS
jgi:hypothetical protein